MVLGLLTFAGFLGIVSVSVAHIVVEEHAATLGRWISVLAFATVIFAAAAWCAKTAIEVLVAVLGRQWEVVLDGGAVAGIVRTTFGTLTFGSVMHARIVQTARSFEVTTADVAACGKDLVRGATRAASLQSDATFTLMSLLAGVVSLDLVKMYRVEQRVWTKPSLFSRRRTVTPVHTLLFERTKVDVSSAPAPEAAFATALEVLGQNVTKRTRFPLADVMYAMRSPWAPHEAQLAAPTSVQLPYRTQGTEPLEVAARLDGFFGDLRADQLAFDEVPSQLVMMLELARQHGVR